MTAGAVFITRRKRNAHCRPIAEQTAAGDGILADRLLQIGHRQPRGGAPLNPLYQVSLREIVVARPDHDQPLYLLTNDLQRPAVEIARLYKERWDIELLFKWLKQNLKIRRFLGRSENAVRIQIYVALIAFMLLHILHHTAARAFNRQHRVAAHPHQARPVRPIQPLPSQNPTAQTARRRGRQTRNLASPSNEPKPSQNPGQQCAKAEIQRPMARWLPLAPRFTLSGG